MSLDLILVFALGLGGGIFLPIIVSLTVNVFTKNGRIISLLRTSVGAILGGLVAAVVAIIMPLKLLNLIPLHEQFAFYMLGFGLGVLCFRLFTRSKIGSG